MAKSDNLRKAKENKNDEFYTLLTDIENELKNYKEYLNWLERVFVPADLKVVYDNAADCGFLTLASSNLADTATSPW